MSIIKDDCQYGECLIIPFIRLFDILKNINEKVAKMFKATLYTLIMAQIGLNTHPFKN